MFVAGQVVFAFDYAILFRNPEYLYA